MMIKLMATVFVTSCCAIILRLLIMRGASCAIRVLSFSILFVVNDVDDAGDDDHVGVDVVITVDEGAPDAT
jgi:hypothetical protein